MSTDPAYADRHHHAPHRFLHDASTATSPPPGLIKCRADELGWLESSRVDAPPAARWWYDSRVDGKPTEVANSKAFPDFLEQFVRHIGVLWTPIASTWESVRLAHFGVDLKNLGPNGLNLTHGTHAELLGGQGVEALARVVQHVLTRPPAPALLNEVGLR